MNHIHFLLIVGLVSTLVGCNGNKFSVVEPVPPIQNDPDPVPFDRPSCEVPEIDYWFDAQVLELVLTSDKGISFGFSHIPGLDLISISACLTLVCLLSALLPFTV